MTGKPTRHHRRSIRLRDYDYSQIGAYFLTICAHHRAFLFGDIVNGEMRTNAAGQVVQATWEMLPSHYPGVTPDAFVIMPNHIHGIVVIDCVPNHSSVGAQFIAPPSRTVASGGAINRAPTPDRAPTLGGIIRGFKARTPHRLHRNLGIVRVWQRNYYEHVIRGNASLARIREYITNNPLRWAFDRENPVHDVATDY
jgi:REP element-mobilizing transposase RayT